MEYLSIGIGILSVGSGLLFKVVGYVRKTDRALASFERGMLDLGHQLQSHVTQSQAEFQGIKDAIDRLETRIEEARNIDG
jgi:hypothetical protein